MGWIAWCQEQPQDKNELEGLMSGTTLGWVGLPGARNNPSILYINVLGVFYTWRQQDKDNTRDFSAKQVYINIKGNIYFAGFSLLLFTVDNLDIPDCKIVQTILIVIPNNTAIIYRRIPRINKS